MEKGWVNRLIVTFMSLCGTVLLSGVLISTISNIIERRVDAIKSGRVTYRKIKQHYVIIGFCDTTISLIKEICKKEKNTPVLLISGVQTEKIRSAIQSHLSKDDENRVVIYFGNIESEEELARLNIHMAKELYLSTDMFGFLFHKAFDYRDENEIRFSIYDPTEDPRFIHDIDSAIEIIIFGYKVDPTKAFEYDLQTQATVYRFYFESPYRLVNNTINQQWTKGYGRLEKITTVFFRPKRRTCPLENG